VRTDDAAIDACEEALDLPRGGVTDLVGDGVRAGELPLDLGGVLGGVLPCGGVSVGVGGFPPGDELRFLPDE